MIRAIKSWSWVENYQVSGEKVTKLTAILPLIVRKILLRPVVSEHNPQKSPSLWLQPLSKNKNNPTNSIFELI